MSRAMTAWNPSGGSTKGAPPKPVRKSAADTSATARRVLAVRLNAR